MPPPGSDAPGILALADHDRLRRLLAGAGFSEPVVHEVGFTWHFPDRDAYWDFLAGAAGAIALVLDRLDDDELARVHEEIAERVAPYAGVNGIELPAVSVVAAAT